VTWQERGQCHFCGTGAPHAGQRNQGE
jgi:hypothetical protein